MPTISMFYGILIQIIVSGLLELRLRLDEAECARRS